jgi:hypothetical protein
MRHLLRVGITLVVLCVSFGYSVAPAGADATVYPKSGFTFVYGSSIYEGFCTSRIVNGDLINSCVGTIVSGPKVSERTLFATGNLHGVLTTSGKVIELIMP